MIKDREEFSLWRMIIDEVLLVLFMIFVWVGFKLRILKNLMSISGR